MERIDQRLGKGMRKLEEQHQGIAALMSAARKVVAECHHDSGALSRVMDEMVRHSKEHFRLEESLMLLAGYPGLLGHRRLHKEFNQKAEWLQEHPQQLAQLRLVPSVLLSFLADWWKQHIIEADKDYELFVAGYLEQLTAAPKAGPAVMSPGL